MNPVSENYKSGFPRVWAWVIHPQYLSITYDGLKMTPTLHKIEEKRKMDILEDTGSSSGMFSDNQAIKNHNCIKMSFHV